MESEYYCEQEDIPHQNVPYHNAVSGRVLDSNSRGCGFEPHRRHCIVSFSKAFYALLRIGSTEEDLSRNSRKIVDWDVKNQNIMIYV